MIALIAFLSVCGYYKKQRLERQARKAASVRTMMLDIQNKSVDTKKAIVEIPKTAQTTIDKRSTKQYTIQSQQPKNTQPKESTPPLSTATVHHILRSAYFPFCENGEKKSLQFYRCSGGKITVGYGCNVQTDPHKMDYVDIFHQLNQAEKIALIKQIKNAKNAAEKEELMGRLSLDGATEKTDDFINRIKKLSDKNLSKQLKKVKITQQLNDKQKADFKKKMKGLSATKLESYFITEEGAKKLYNRSFNETVTCVAKFLSDEKGKTFFYDLPFQWQLVCIDIAYQRGPAGFREFRKLKNALKARDYKTAANEIGTKTPRRLGIRKVMLKTGEMAFNYLSQCKQLGQMYRLPQPDYMTEIKNENFLPALDVKSMQDAITMQWEKMTQVRMLISDTQLKEYEKTLVVSAGTDSTLKDTLKENRQQQATQTPPLAYQPHR